MARGLILETTFLIDLERQARKSAEGPALDFLEANADAGLHLTFTVIGELAAGVSMAQRRWWEAFIAPFRILESSPEVAWHYGEAYRFLRANGLLIGANDLWIAATALAYDLPVVTRNEKHFRRVPGLEVVSYS